MGVKCITVTSLLARCCTDTCKLYRSKCYFNMKLLLWALGSWSLLFGLISLLWIRSQQYLGFCEVMRSTPALVMSSNSTVLTTFPVKWHRSNTFCWLWICWWQKDISHTFFIPEIAGQNGLVVQRVSVITELKAPDLVRYFSLKPVCSSAAGQSGSLRLINTDSQRKRVKRR